MSGLVIGGFLALAAWGTGRMIVGSRRRRTAQALVKQFNDPRAAEAVDRLERIPADAPNRDRDGNGDVAFSGPVVFLPQDGNFASVGVIKVPDARPYRLAFEACIALVEPSDLVASPVVLFGAPGMGKTHLLHALACRAKDLGRRVEGFDQKVWEQHRIEIVVTGSIAKFGSDQALHAYLVGTGSRVLVEASPLDSIWGIGLARDSPLVECPQQWRGVNLLGFALMEARQRLAQSI